MKKVSRFSILILYILLISQIANSQQYKWVRGGGTAESLSSFRYDEASYFVCTDPNGNTYSLNVVGGFPIYADTFYRSGAYGLDQNILLTSYNCAGQMRWSKLIASSGGECIPNAIICDSIGHVYISGQFINGTLYIGDDTSISGLLNDALGVMQFDTGGHFTWVRYVGNNTASTYAGTYGSPNTLAIDSFCNVHLITGIYPHVVLMPGDTSHYGIYDIKYNYVGNLINTKRLRMDTSLGLGGAIIDKKSSKLYIYGYRNPSFTDSSYHCFLAAFDTSRNLIWMDTLADPGYESSQGIQGVECDGYGHLYVIGGGTNNVVYQGDTAHNVLSRFGTVAFVMKTDTAGRPIWMKNYSSSSGVNYFAGITLMPNNKVAAAGAMATIVVQGIDTMWTYSGEGQNSTFTILDSSGHLIDMKQIHGDGFYDNANTITSDQYGNLYIGGKVANTTWGGTIPAYHTHGGNSDFYVMKYGYECGCTSAAASSFTSTGTITVNVTYTGTTASLDSVVWTYGDGFSNTGTTAAHTYTASGTYTVCAIAHSGCGIDTSCHSVVINIPSAINAVPGFENVLVYPNPTGSEINITGLNAMTKYQLQDITGQTISDGSLFPGNNIISLDKLSIGIYMLALETVDGSKTVVRVVKDR